MSAEKIPQSISESEIEVCGLKIKVHVLDDGRRIIESQDMEGIMHVLRGWLRNKKDPA